MSWVRPDELTQQGGFACSRGADQQNACVTILWGRQRYNFLPQFFGLSLASLNTVKECRYHDAIKLFPCMDAPVQAPPGWVGKQHVELFDQTIGLSVICRAKAAPYL